MAGLTEEEAGHKVCPHMTYIVNQEHVFNGNQPPIYDNRYCIASQCMAWRIKPYVVNAGDGVNVDIMEDRGFCGLAGH